MFAEMNGDVTLEKWLTNYVHGYLGNHVVKIRTGSYVTGAFDHYTDGIIQAYKTLFNTEDTMEVLYILKVLCRSNAIDRNKFCFCGSHKKYKRCFDLDVEKHRMNIPLDILRNDFNEVTRHLKYIRGI